MIKKTGILLNSVLLSALLTSVAFATDKPMSAIKANPLEDPRHMEGKRLQVAPKKRFHVHGQHHAPNMGHIKPFVLNEVIVESDSELFADELRAIYEPFLGKTVTVAEIAEINRLIADLYITKGYLLPRPFLPAQDFKNGVAKIIVKLDSIRNVVIIGEGESNQLMREYASKIMESKPTNIKSVQKYLILMNKLSGYEAHYSLRHDNPNAVDPNQNPIDLVIITTKQKAAVHARVDNYGIKDLGRYQGTIFSQLYSPFNNNESIIFQVAGTNKLNRMHSIAAGYHQPINNMGTSVSVLGSWARDNVTKNQVVKAKDNNSKLLIGTIGHYLLLDAKNSLKLIGSLQHFNGDFNTVANGKAQKSSNLKTYEAGIALKFKNEDNFGGKNLINAGFYKGLGGRIKYYTTGQAKIDKNYNLFSFDAYRDQELMNNFSIFGHFEAQFSSSKLPGNEEFAVGGRSFGRGYEFGTLSSDKAIGLSLEARYTHHMTESYLTEIQPYAFYDVAKIFKKMANTNVTTLASAGPGVRLNFVEDISLGAEVAIPFKRSMKVENESYKPRSNFNFFLSKTFKF